MIKIIQLNYFLNLVFFGIFSTFSLHAATEKIIYVNGDGFSASNGNPEEFSTSFVANLGISETLDENEPLVDVDNLDKFPAKDHLTFSRLQVPWKRATGPYNANHDLVTVRITNKGAAPLTINNLTISNNNYFVINKISGSTYSGSLPVNLNTRQFIDVTIKFVAVNPGSWHLIKILHETLTITSNDPNNPNKIVYLHGLWQLQGEDVNEPSAQNMIDAFGYKTRTGFGMYDSNKGDPSKLKGDEIFSPYFVRADPTKQVYVRQLAAYHGCCNDTETFSYNHKGTTDFVNIFRHIREDGQTLLPRTNANTNAPAEGSFTPNVEVFGFKIKNDYSDPSLNIYAAYPDHSNKIGVRVWKVFDAQGKIVPNAYIVANDYLGTQWTNYDYNDNMYYVSNIKPEIGTAYYSELSPSPSSLDFDKKETGSTNSITLNLKSLGKTYNNGTADPTIIINKVELTGLNHAEFKVSNPVAANLAPQASTTLTVDFKPVTPGFKMAELLIHYNMSESPLRVPIYAISTNDCKEIIEHLRIKSGSNSNVTSNGKIWVADTPYRKGNIKLDVPFNVNAIAGTDDDEVYINYLSSINDHNEIKYQIPLANGEYMVRLHFSENYWENVGERVFTISIEDEIKIPNFDILKEVKPKTALVKNFPITVDDEILDIGFSPTINRLSIAAVEIYEVNDGTGISLNATVQNPSCDLENGVINVSAGDSQQVTYRLGTEGSYQSSGTFENIAPGTYTIYAKASSGECEATLQVLVEDTGCANQPPIVNNPINDQVAKEGTPFNFTFSANTFVDPDPDDVLSYTATLADNSELPSWLVFNPLSRSFSGTPTLSDVGVIEIKVTATDKRDAFVSDYFLLSISNINEPFIEEIANITILQDTQAGPVQFTIHPGDEEMGEITISSDSDNEDLIPVSHILLAGNGAERTFTITPAQGKYGTANITITLKGNDSEVSRTFMVIVLKQNEFPVISKIDDVNIMANTSTGPLEFVVTDEGNQENNLIITGVSDNQELVPDGNILFGGSGKNRTINVTPIEDKVGTAVITIQVFDDLSMAETSFNLMVSPITGINNENLESKIKIYPNPARNNITVHLENQVMGMTSLFLLDAKGKILKFINFEKSNNIIEFNLELEPLSSGSYIIKVQQKNTVSFKKFIKY